MALRHDGETPEQEAERLAETERHRVFAQRVRVAQAQQEQARLRVKAKIREALDLIEAAPGDLLHDVRCERAVAGTDFRSQRPSAPSLGGLRPDQLELIARQQASAAQGIENDRRARERWIADQDATVHALQAGQSPDNQAQVAAAIRAQKRSG